MGSGSGQNTSKRVFFLLRQGERESAGPFSEIEVEDLLNAREYSKCDLINYPELKDWSPIETVFDFHDTFVDFSTDGQDEGTLQFNYEVVRPKLNEGETISYIAIQRFDAETITSTVLLHMPQSVVLTSQRMFVVVPQLEGVPDLIEMASGEIDFLTKQAATLEHESILLIVLRSGDVIEIKRIPDLQVEKLEQLANAAFQSELLERSVENV